MEWVDLITIEDAFEIRGRGLVLIPDFSIPIGWKDRDAQVILKMPDGKHHVAYVRFNLSHFNLSDPKVAMDNRWRVVTTLHDWEHGKPPAGTKMLVPPEIRNALLKEPTAG